MSVVFAERRDADGSVLSPHGPPTLVAAAVVVLGVPEGTKAVAPALREDGGGGVVTPVVCSISAACCCLAAAAASLRCLSSWSFFFLASILARNRASLSSPPLLDIAASAMPPPPDPSAPVGWVDDADDVGQVEVEAAKEAALLPKPVAVRLSCGSSPIMLLSLVVVPEKAGALGNVAVVVDAPKPNEEEVAAAGAPKPDDGGAGAAKEVDAVVAEDPNPEVAGKPDEGALLLNVPMVGVVEELPKPDVPKPGAPAKEAVVVVVVGATLEEAPNDTAGAAAADPANGLGGAAAEVDEGAPNATGVPKPLLVVVDAWAMETGAPNVVVVVVAPEEGAGVPPKGALPNPGCCCGGGGVLAPKGAAVVVEAPNPNKVDGAAAALGVPNEVD